MAKPADLDLGDWNQMVQSFHEESDRGAAILAGSFAEHSLGIYLRWRMRDPRVADELFAPMGPLSSFRQRTAIAYAFGLVTEKFYRDFELIRRIRNYFAHHPLDTSFETKEIRRLTDQLSSIELITSELYPDPRERARAAYLIACGLCCGKLLDEIETANIGNATKSSSL